jgi:anti-sigma B factor antagonist
MAELDDGGTTASVARLSDDRRTPAVSIAGEIDISNADQVKAALLAEVGDAPQHIIVDVSALTFMDSSGIAILVQVSKSVAPVELRNPTPIVRRVIKATGLSEHFGMAE